MTTDEQLQQIKQSFRLMMDGATAQSMRDKGLHYHLNWGATLPRLREMAQTIAPSYSLAIALWKENVRECKILATMIMPPDEMLPDVADLWMEQTPTIEIAEQAAFNLYQHMPAAPDMAYRWIASPDDLTQLCGYHILSRLFMQRREPNERGINEFVDQATAALRSPNISLRKAAMQAVSRFAQLGLLYDRIARSALRSQGLDFL